MLGTENIYQIEFDLFTVSEIRKLQEPFHQKAMSRGGGRDARTQPSVELVNPGTIQLLTVLAIRIKNRFQ